MLYIVSFKNVSIFFIKIHNYKINNYQNEESHLKTTSKRIKYL